MQQLASEFAGVATLLQSVAKAISDVNFPLRLDKLDASVAASFATVQGLQTRFDALKTDIQQTARSLQLEIQSSVDRCATNITTCLAQLRADVEAVTPAVETACNQILAYEASRFDALNLAISAAGESLSVRQAKTTKTIIISTAVLAFLVIVGIALGIALPIR